ncbi:hypothetical protein B0H16DRAFT_1454516 [Mycena metata]|uniref:Uncharacterized protein n=1 Tax=Mycena metata TaxID=1033252 RepID=A0AAD7JJQ8_9AGAR|nr:hypothetical protein B0H16DRAFT_1454516 [Mycena metata]
MEALQLERKRQSTAQDHPGPERQRKPELGGNTIHSQKLKLWPYTGVVVGKSRIASEFDPTPHKAMLMSARACSKPPPRDCTLWLVSNGSEYHLTEELHFSSLSLTVDTGTGPMARKCRPPISRGVLYGPIGSFFLSCVDSWLTCIVMKNYRPRLASASPAVLYTNIYSVSGVHESLYKEQVRKPLAFYKPPGHLFAPDCGATRNFSSCSARSEFLVAIRTMHRAVLTIHLHRGQPSSALPLCRGVRNRRLAWAKRGVRRTAAHIDSYLYADLDPDLKAELRPSALPCVPEAAADGGGFRDAGRAARHLDGIAHLEREDDADDSGSDAGGYGLVTPKLKPTTSTRPDPSALACHHLVLIGGGRFAVQGLGEAACLVLVLGDVARGVEGGGAGLPRDGEGDGAGLHKCTTAAFRRYAGEGDACFVPSPFSSSFFGKQLEMEKETELDCTSARQPPFIGPSDGSSSLSTCKWDEDDKGDGGSWTGVRVGRSSVPPHAYISDALRACVVLISTPVSGWAGRVEARWRMEKASAPISPPCQALAIHVFSPVPYIRSGSSVHLGPPPRRPCRPSVFLIVITVPTGLPRLEVRLKPSLFTARAGDSPCMRYPLDGFPCRRERKLRGERHAVQISSKFPDPIFCPELVPLDSESQILAKRAARSGSAPKRDHVQPPWRRSALVYQISCYPGVACGDEQSRETIRAWPPVVDETVHAEDANRHQADKGRDLTVPGDVASTSTMSGGARPQKKDFLGVGSSAHAYGESNPDHTAAQVRLFVPYTMADIPRALDDQVTQGENWDILLFPP